MAVRSPPVLMALPPRAGFYLAFDSLHRIAGDLLELRREDVAGHGEANPFERGSTFTAGTPSR